MKLEASLLPDEHVPGNFGSLSARGTYNPMRFVLALRPDVLESLSSIDGDASLRAGVDGEAVEAFSTYFHETIHWWQHIGSTTGLMLSLSYPAQSHCSLDELRQVLAAIGPKKSLLQWNFINAVEAEAESQLHHQVNTVLNNWHDLRFFRQLIIDPRTVQSAVDNQYFESSGHAYYIAYAHVCSLLADTLESEKFGSSSPQYFSTTVRELKEAGIAGYAYGTQESVTRIGARQIMEGQACLSQLQYLTAASNGKVTLRQFADAGMLHGVYLEALAGFLAVLEENTPDSAFDPLIGLFLLLCDISINPYEGFPLQVSDPEGFRRNIDPGFRFLMCCQAAAKIKPQLLGAVEACDADAYFNASALICRELNWPTPRDGLNRIVALSTESDAGRALLEEAHNFRFQPKNLPVRLLLARYLVFCDDKLREPHFFCWPGYWSSLHNGSEESAEKFTRIFVEHESLFRLKPDGAVYPRLFPNKDQSALSTAFNAFYSFSMLYEVIDEWVMLEGDWEHDVSWVSALHDRTEVIDAVDRLFQGQFGVRLAEFEVL